MTLDHLRSRLEALEDAVQRAGDAWLAAEEAGVPEADVIRLLRSFNVHGRTKLGWLRDGGELLRWHRGEAPSCLAHDPAHQSHPAEAEAQI
jgi:hypothetical protein